MSLETLSFEILYKEIALKLDLYDFISLTQTNKYFMELYKYQINDLNNMKFIQYHPNDQLSNEYFDIIDNFYDDTLPIYVLKQIAFGIFEWSIVEATDICNIRSLIITITNDNGKREYTQNIKDMSLEIIINELECVMFH
jgi:hypothetical protein